ncbi:unnamed protein product [Brachionus calyciflorus]|uniref:Uncharacterized protein n=1 Tax=Brachionus calyciflorus TaxID=104777 RepID=A0A813RGS1_9BILA|nr:unnamed protein product [Brachionus calyciflorus]
MCCKNILLKELEQFKLVRPHLEYAVSVWCPLFKSDISILEKVQRRAKNLVKSIRDKPYDSRLNFLNLQNLEERRVTGDLIQMYKLINGLEKLKLVNDINYATSLAVNLRRPNNKRLVREINSSRLLTEKRLKYQKPNSKIAMALNWARRFIAQV